MSCAFDLNVWVYVHEMPTVKLHIKVLLTLLWIVWSKSILTVYFRPKLISSIKMGEVWPMSTHVVMTTDTTHGFDYHQWWITDFIFITISSVALIEQSTGFSPFESSHSSTLAKNSSNGRHICKPLWQTNQDSQIKETSSKKVVWVSLNSALWRLIIFTREEKPNIFLSSPFASRLNVCYSSLSFSSRQKTNKSFFHL